MSDFTEKLLASRTVYRGKIIKLRVDTVVLPDGRTGNREVVEYTGAVAVVPVNENRELLMVRQYRHAAGKTLLEIPAGKLEPDEDPKDCARRELLEETGFKAGKLDRLFSFFSTPGFTTEKLHLFLAADLKCSKQNLDEDEFIDVVTVPFEQALAMIWAGEICDGKSVAGIFAAHILENEKLL
jgi:ADP-ribose pyrophosphatase